MDYHSETVDISDYRTLQQIQTILQEIIDLYVDDEGHQSINISATTRYEICHLDLSSLSSLQMVASKHLPLLNIPTTPTTPTKSGKSHEDDTKEDTKVDILLDELWSETETDGKVEDDQKLQIDTSMDGHALYRSKEDKLRLKEYLNKFETAIEEVVWLLRQDCLLRFYQSEEYKQF